MLKESFQSLYSNGVSQHLRGLMPFHGLSGMVHRALFSELVTVEGNRAITADDHNKTFMVKADATLTLPAATAAIAGLRVTARMNAARTTVQITFTPATGDGIYGTTNASTNVVFSGTDNASIKNTKASAEKGDCITLECDGVNGWFVASCHGIWANV